MTSDTWPQYHTNIPYSSQSRLNTLDICLPHRPSTADPTQTTPNPNELWIVYIHGGAWRDPAIDSSSFLPTQDLLLSHNGHDDNTSKHIAGLASINYRLSPYPTHATDPSTPSDLARNAHHPDHISDVLTAVRHLQRQHPSAKRYILIGHSCGATLVLQLAMQGSWRNGDDSDLALPLAILGIEGIYDLPDLLQRYTHPAYRQFVTGAFGEDEDVWTKVSPTCPRALETGWPESGLVMLMHSEDDGLVGMEQPELMWEALGRQGWGDDGVLAGRKRRRFIKIKGLEHDQVWREGGEIARAIRMAVEDLTTAS